MSFFYFLGRGVFYVFAVGAGARAPPKKQKKHTPPPKQRKETTQKKAPSDRVVVFAVWAGGCVICFSCLGGGRVIFLLFKPGACYFFCCFGGGT